MSAASRSQAVRTISDDFKAFFRQLASGVCVVTLWADGRLHGFTATSVTSVSLDPPTALFCVAQRNDSHGLLHVGAPVGVSLLGRDQRHLSDCFAAKAGPDGYDHVETTRPDLGMPTLAGALGFLRGSVIDLVPQGDHSIVIFRISDASASLAMTPIIYLNQGYHVPSPL